MNDFCSMLQGCANSKPSSAARRRNQLTQHLIKKPRSTICIALPKRHNHKTAKARWRHRLRKGANFTRLRSNVFNGLSGKNRLISRPRQSVYGLPGFLSRFLGRQGPNAGASLVGIVGTFLTWRFSIRRLAHCFHSTRLPWSLLQHEVRLPRQSHEIVTLLLGVRAAVANSPSILLLLSFVSQASVCRNAATQLAGSTIGRKRFAPIPDEAPPANVSRAKRMHRGRRT